MNKIVLGLLIGSALFANQPDYNAVANQMYLKMKESTLGMSKNMLTKMGETRECFAKANSKEDAKKCGEIMSLVTTEAEKKIADAFGIDESEIKAEKRKHMDKLENMKWDEKEKQNILLQLDKGIKEGTVTTKCMEENSEFKGFRACMKKQGLDK